MRKYIIEVEFIAFNKKVTEFIVLQKTNAPDSEEIKKLAIALIKDICFTSIINKITAYEVKNEVEIKLL